MADRAAGAGFMISNFLGGYMQGMQRAQMLKHQKAMGLMDMAMNQSKLMETQKDPELRALYMKQINENMTQADKALHEKVGLWGHISQAMKGKGDGLVDPHELAKKLGYDPDVAKADAGMEITGNTPDQSQGGGPPLPNDYVQPPGVATASQPQPIQAFQDRPDGVNPPVAQTPALGGPSTQPKQTITTDTGTMQYGVQEEPAQTDITNISGVFGTNQRPMGGIQVSELGLPPGTVSERKATGKGLESVYIRPGVIDYRFNNQSITPGEHDKLASQIGVRGIERQWSNEDTAANQQSALRMAIERKRAEMQEETAQRKQTYEEFEKQETAAGRKIEPAVRNQILFGIQRPTLHPDDFTWEDDAGITHKAVKDLNTGQIIPGTEQVMPMSAHAMQIKAFQEDTKNWKNGQKPTWAQASEMFYRDMANDNRVKDAVRQAQLENAQDLHKNRQEVLEAKKRAANGTSTKADIKAAMTRNHAAAMAAAMRPAKLPDGTDDPTQKQFDLATFNTTRRALITSELGITWEQVQKAYGGDPLVAKEFEADQVKAQADAAARALGGGRGTGTGSGSKYTPSDSTKK